MRRRPEPAGKTRQEEMTPKMVTLRMEVPNESIKMRRKVRPKMTESMPKEGARTRRVRAERVKTPRRERPVPRRMQRRKA